MSRSPINQALADLSYRFKALKRNDPRGLVAQNTLAASIIENLSVYFDEEFYCTSARSNSLVACQELLEKLTHRVTKERGAAASYPYFLAEQFFKMLDLESRNTTTKRKIA